MRVSAGLCTLVALTALAASIAASGPRGAQAPQSSAKPQVQQANAIVVGQVVDGTTGKPVGDVFVTLSWRAPAGRNPGPQAVTQAGSRGGRVLTDGQGRFVFRDLLPGAYSVIATKPGYLGGSFGQRSPSADGRGLDLNESERVGNVTLRIWPPGVISGVVQDENGAPAVSVRVALFQRVGSNGQWVYRAGQTTTTDDRGSYRIGSLMPGTYLAAVKPDMSGASEALVMGFFVADQSSAIKMMPKLMERGEESILMDPSLRSYRAVYYPNAKEPSQATALTIESGSERAGVDFRVAKAPMLRVAGAIDDVGFDWENYSVQVTLSSSETGTVDPQWAPDLNGNVDQRTKRFVFSFVPAGSYVLEAIARPRGSGRGAGPGSPALAAPEEPTFSTRLPITLTDKSLPDLHLSLQPGGRVYGRASFEGGDRPASELWPQISVTLEGVGRTASTARGRVESDGSFRTASVPPGSYWLRVGVLVGREGGGPFSPIGASSAVAGAPKAGVTWRPRSAMVGGREALDQPIEIGADDIGGVVLAFSSAPLGSITGTVRDLKGVGDPDAAVVIFPVDNKLWTDFTASSRRIRVVRPSRYGVYNLANLPAGDYWVAVSDDQAVGLQNPGALDGLTRNATRVLVVEGQSKTVDLKSGGR